LQHAGDTKELVEVDALVVVVVHLTQEANDGGFFQFAAQELLEAARELGSVDVSIAVGVELAEEGASSFKVLHPALLCRRFVGFFRSY
jgi:hypothetical protein